MGLQGNAEFVGIFGLTGEFSGWFWNDDARIPIVAKMQVIIGSVTIELMSWKRPGAGHLRASKGETVHILRHHGVTPRVHPSAFVRQVRV